MNFACLFSAFSLQCHNSGSKATRQESARLNVWSVLTNFNLDRCLLVQSPGRINQLFQVIIQVWRTCMCLLDGNHEDDNELAACAVDFTPMFLSYQAVWNVPVAAFHEGHSTWQVSLWSWSARQPNDIFDDSCFSSRPHPLSTDVTTGSCGTPQVFPRCSHRLTSMATQLVPSGRSLNKC